MRKSTDTCLLCRMRPATKAKSHIFSKFLSTDFLGEKGQPRRGNELSSEQPHTNKSKVVQDSPKEDFILCPGCEHFLGILEGQAADTYQHWRQHVHIGKFQEYLMVKDLTIVQCDGANPRVLRLLVYSMFWRLVFRVIPFLKVTGWSLIWRNRLGWPCLL